MNSVPTFGPQPRHAARGSTTVHASFGKLKVRRVNSGGARKFHGLGALPGSAWPRMDARAGPAGARACGDAGATCGNNGRF